MGLSESQLSQFRTDGFVFPVRVMDSDQAEVYRTCLKKFQARCGMKLPPPWQFKSYLFLRWVDEIIRLPALLDAVESVIGPDILCWSSGFFIKFPNSREHVGWHQDVKYWGLSPHSDVVTAWIALSDVTSKSGPVQYAPGTHVFSLLPHTRTDDARNTLYFRQKLSVPVDESKAVVALMGAGEASLHSSLVVHRSGVNTSAVPRVGLAVRFVSTRVFSSGRESASLVRGKDEFGHFEHEPRPSGDFDPAGIAAHRRALSLQGANRRRFR